VLVIGESAKEIEENIKNIMLKTKLLKFFFTILSLFLINIF
jgi:hypothetical protein